MGSATLAIAIVGAATGIAGLAWQVYTWTQARKSRVVVQLGEGEVQSGVYAYLGLIVRVVNDNDYPIHIEAAGLKQDGSGADSEFVDEGEFEMPPDMIPGTISGLPGSVAVHGVGHAELLLRDAVEEAGFDLNQPIVAWARMVNGDRLCSEPYTPAGRELGGRSLLG